MTCRSTRNRRRILRHDENLAPRWEACGLGPQAAFGRHLDSASQRGCLIPRAPGPPPEKMVGVGFGGLTTEPEDMIGALGNVDS